MVPVTPPSPLLGAGLPGELGPVEPAITIGSNGWIHYNDSVIQRASTLSTQTRTISGEAGSGGGCVFKAAAKSPTPWAGVVEEETAYNPLTCQETLATATVSNSELAELERTAGAAAGPPLAPTQRAVATASSRGTPSRRTAARAARTVSYDSAHTKVQWIDPLSITITSLVIDISWPLHDQSGPVNSVVYSYAFPWDHWTNTGIKGPYKNYIEGYSPEEVVKGTEYNNESGWESSAHETFYNTDFVALLKKLGVSGACTEANKRTEYYHNIKVYGHSEGEMGYWEEDQKKGACNNLVHHVLYAGWGWDGKESEYFTGKFAQNKEFEQEASGGEGTLPPNEPPAVRATPASSLTETGATLNGYVNPDKLDTRYYFEYGSTEAYGNIIPASPGMDIGSGGGNVTCWNAIGGLSPGTEYHYRIVAVNREGASYSGDQSFRTPKRPSVTTEGASELRPFSAVVHGSVDPNENETIYDLEYGETPSYGAQVPQPGAYAGAGNQWQGVSEGIGGLQPCTTYHYRMFAVNSFGEAAYGGDSSFLTRGLPKPIVHSIPETWVKYGPTNDYIMAVAPCAGLIHKVSMQLPAGGAEVFSQEFPCNCEESVTSNNINLSGQPTGVYPVGTYAEDPWGDRVEEKPHPTLYVDHTSPILSVTGTATEAKEGQVGEGSYTVTASTVDGSAAAPQIGTAEAWVEVDGVRQESWKSLCGRPLGIPAEGCYNLNGTWSFTGEQLGIGQHAITVAAKDWLGNESSHTFTVTVHGAGTSPVGPGQVNLLTGDLALAAEDLPTSGGPTGLSVNRVYHSRRLSAGAGEQLGAGWQLTLSEDGVAGWRNLVALPNGSVTLTVESGQRYTFAAKEGGGFIAPPGLASVALSGPSGSPATFRVTDAKGNVTSFTVPSAGGTTYLPSTIERASAGSGSTVTYTYGVDEANKAIVPIKVLGGVPAGVSCSPTMNPGCRALTFNYAASTTATGSGESSTEWGDYAGQLTRVYVEAYDPEKRAMATRTAAQYAYDSHGRLRAEFDPLITPVIKTTYAYDSAGHVAALAPPAQEPWKFEYAAVGSDPNNGRLAAVSRYNPELGQTATETLRYGVALAGVEGASNLETAQTTLWSQTDVPTTGTAIFPPDVVPAQPPKTYQRAHLIYLDALGRTVDDARSGEGVEVHEYENRDNLVRKLSAANRAAALAAGGEAPAKSKLLDTQLSYNTTGAAPAGSELTETLGPQHNIQLSTGSEVQARDRTHYEYDAGEPGSGPHFLVTKVTEGAQYSGGEADVRTDTRSYSAQSNLGWKLHEPTSTTINPESLNLVSTEAFEAATGAATESSTPSSSSAGLYYQLQFGAGGSSEGQFSGAKGVAVSNMGNVFIADSANNRVQKFSANGVYQQSFGPACSLTSATPLSVPAGVAVDSQGDVWVLDTGNNRVVEYSAEGACLAVIGQKGAAAGQFEAPQGIAADQFGNLWVADTGNMRVQEISPTTGKSLLAFGAKGTGEGKFKTGPTSVALDAQGDVWTSDPGNFRLQEFSAQGQFIRAVGSKGSGEGQFATGGPAGIAVNPEGSQVSVLDPGNARIETFDSEGHYIGKAGSEGSGHFQFKAPTGVALNASGGLYVVDSGNARVQELRPVAGPLNAHATKAVNYTAASNSTAPACGAHPEWAGLPCLVTPMAQPETTGVSNLPVSEIAYSFFDEPQEVTQMFSSQANMVTNPSFETGLKGWSAGSNLWVAGGAKLARASSGQFGKASLEIIAAGNPNEGADTAVPGIFKARTSYTASIHVEGAKAASGLQLRFGDPATSDSAVNSEVAVGAAWTRYSVTWTPTRTATYALLMLTDPHTGALAWNADAAQVTVSPKAVAYADGEQAGSSWAGNAGESVTLQPTNTRTQTYSYDSSGRLKSAGMSANFGTSLPSTTYEYSLTNGLLTNVIANATEHLTLSYTWSKLGQMISYKDSTGINSESRYDLDGRISFRSDGAGVQTYTYSGTTGKLGNLSDTSGMNFTAEYTPAGQLKSVGYPNGMAANYTYDPTGEKVGVEYGKSKTVWYRDAVVPTIHGQWATQTSSFSKQAYAYDAAGRLTQVQSTPSGEGCTTRIYQYDQDGNRTSLTTAPPNSKGECASTGGTTETHVYDAADRLIDDGTVYDPAGDLAALPGADNAGGANLTSTFYSDSSTDTQSEEGETTGYLLDPEQRPREAVLSGLTNATITTHYAGPGYRPSWRVTEPGGEWVRDIYGIEGDVAAIETNGSPTSLEVENLHGDVVATTSPSTSAGGLASNADATEFGDPTTGRPPTNWWLGGFGLTTQEYSGTLLMGGRAYQPQIGRFLQPNPEPATSEDSYSYLFNDPINSRNPSGEGSLTPTNGSEPPAVPPASTPGGGALAPFPVVQPLGLAAELTEQPLLAATSPPNTLTPETLALGKQW